MEAKEVNGMGILRQPLYQQVEKVIEEGILRGEWKAGEALPSEAALAGRYGVSVCTVRRALDELPSLGIFDPKTSKEPPWLLFSCPLQV